MEVPDLGNPETMTIGCFCTDLLPNAAKKFSTTDTPGLSIFPPSLFVHGDQIEKVA